MDKEIRGHTLEYWRNNAKENYRTTPISVLKYLTILEEELKQENDIKQDVIGCLTKENKKGMQLALDVIKKQDRYDLEWEWMKKHKGGRFIVRSELITKMIASLNCL